MHRTAVTQRDQDEAYVVAVDDTPQRAEDAVPWSYRLRTDLKGRKFIDVSRRDLRRLEHRPKTGSENHRELRRLHHSSGDTTGFSRNR